MFTAKPSKVGVIGLGIIGSRIAEVLRGAELHVYVWSRTPRPVPNFLNSPAGVAELAPLVHLFVRNGEDLLQVVETMEPSLTGKHCVINHATVSLDAARAADRLVRRAGAVFLDCPFTGSKLAAEAGELVYYIAGGNEEIARVMPHLELTSRKIVRVGQRVGDATVLKIATNMISAATVGVLAESLALVRSQDIPAEMLAAVLADSASRSPLLDMKLAAMASGDYDPHFALKNMFKDTSYALKLANAAGIELPALSTVASVMFNAIRDGHGEEDFSVLYKNYPEAKKSASGENRAG